MGSKQFAKDTKGGSGDILKWRDDGKIIGFVHPDGFFTRRTYWFAFEKEDDDGETEIVRAPFVCPGLENRCPICELREFLKEHDDVEEDEVIYSVGKKKKKVEVLKGDALGLKDYDWRQSWVPNKEFLFGFVDVDNPEGGVGIIIASAGCGRAIASCMESRMDDVGDEEGDILKNPWAIKLVYKEKEKIPAQKYKAFHNDAKLTKKIQKLLDGDGPNLDNFVKSITPKELWGIIEDGLQVEGFEPSFLEHEEDEDEEETKSKKKKKRKVKEDEDEEETSKKKKKLKKKKKKREAEEDEDEEETKSKKKKKKLKRKVKKKVEEDEDGDEEDKEETEPCPQCGKELPLSATKCKKCGIEFEIGEDENGDDGEDGDEDEGDDTKECEYCGEKVPKSKKRCPDCGEKL